MNRKRIRTIINNLSHGLAVALIAIAPALLAHGGFDHVMGTVARLSGNILTVKTMKGNVDVRLDDKTELTKESGKAATADLVPGARVVVDITEGSKTKIAHSVKIGVTTAAHDDHK